MSLKLDKLCRYFAKLKNIKPDSPEYDLYKSGFDDAISHAQYTIIQGLDGLKVSASEFEKLKAAINAFNAVE